MHSKASGKLHSTHARWHPCFRYSGPWYTVLLTHKCLSWLCTMTLSLSSLTLRLVQKQLRMSVTWWVSLENLPRNIGDSTFQEVHYCTNSFSCVTPYAVPWLSYLKEQPNWVRPDTAGLYAHVKPSYAEVQSRILHPFLFLMFQLSSNPPLMWCMSWIPSTQCSARGANVADMTHTPFSCTCKLEGFLSCIKAAVFVHFSFPLTAHVPIWPPAPLYCTACDHRQEGISLTSPVPQPWAMWRRIRSYHPLFISLSHSSLHWLPFTSLQHPQHSQHLSSAPLYGTEVHGSHADTLHYVLLSPLHTTHKDNPHTPMRRPLGWVWWPC